AGHPQVSPGGHHPELQHQLGQVLPLVRQELGVRDKSDVPVNDSADGLRPRLKLAGRLRPGVRPLVDDLARRAPLRLGHATSFTAPSNIAMSSADQMRSRGCFALGNRSGNTHDRYMSMWGIPENWGSKMFCITPPE